MYRNLHGNVEWKLTQNQYENLTAYSPKGCPFNDYTMFNLLKDWIDQFSWMFSGYEVRIDEFVSMLMKFTNDIHVNTYGSDMLSLLR